MYLIIDMCMTTGSLAARGWVYPYQFLQSYIHIQSAYTLLSLKLETIFESPEISLTICLSIFSTTQRLITILYLDLVDGF